MPKDTSAPVASVPLPQKLPDGETILWQGRPDTWALAKEALSLKWVAAYCVLVAFWRVGTLIDLMPFWAAVSAAVPFVMVGLLGGAILVALAGWQARSTLYTVTTGRVILQIGAALSVTLNLPLSQIEGADLDLRKSGTGTIALQLKPGSARLSYLVCWPHVRPWRMNPTQPALRCIPGADAVAKTLAAAAGVRSTAADTEVETKTATGSLPVAAE